MFLGEPNLGSWQEEADKYGSLWLCRRSKVWAMLYTTRWSHDQLIPPISHLVPLTPSVILSHSAIFCKVLKFQHLSFYNRGWACPNSYLCWQWSSQFSKLAIVTVLGRFLKVFKSFFQTRFSSKYPVLVTNILRPIFQSVSPLLQMHYVCQFIRMKNCVSQLRW